MIALCDVFVSAVGSIGFPSGGSTLCVLQGLVETFFLRANWFWTTMLVFQLYRFVIFNRIFLKESTMHGCVWLLSAILTFLPLAHGSFGRAGPYETTEMCFVTSSDYNWSAAWILIDWFCTVYVCILIMSLIIARVCCQYLELRDRSDSSKFSETILKLVTTLYVYPLIMLITWGTNATCNAATLWATSSDSNNVAYIVGSTNVAAMSNGILLCVVFFYKSKEARFQWRELLCTLAGPDGHNNKGNDPNNMHTNLDYDDSYDQESTFVTELSLFSIFRGGSQSNSFRIGSHSSSFRGGSHSNSGLARFGSASGPIFNPQLGTIDEFGSFSSTRSSNTAAGNTIKKPLMAAADML